MFMTQISLILYLNSQGWVSLTTKFKPIDHILKSNVVKLEILTRKNSQSKNNAKKIIFFYQFFLISTNIIVEVSYFDWLNIKFLRMW